MLSKPEHRVLLHAQVRPESGAASDPPGSPAGATFDPSFQPFAEKVDTLTEATLIYTFL